jgi:hypothetical protein
VPSWCVPHSTTVRETRSAVSPHPAPQQTSPCHIIQRCETSHGHGYEAAFSLQSYDSIGFCFDVVDFENVPSHEYQPLVRLWHVHRARRGGTFVQRICPFGHGPAALVDPSSEELAHSLGRSPSPHTIKQAVRPALSRCFSAMCPSNPALALDPVVLLQSRFSGFNSCKNASQSVVVILGSFSYCNRNTLLMALVQLPTASASEENSVRLCYCSSLQGFLMNPIWLECVQIEDTSGSDHI